MTAHILGVATAFPRHSASVEVATHYAQQMSCVDDAQAGKLAKLYRRTGVETRGSVLLEEEPAGQITQSFYPSLSDDDHGPTTRDRNERFRVEAPPLAVSAAGQALEMSGCDPSQITHVITVTCTGFNSPGIDIELIEKLGLPQTTQRLQIGFMGCHALINALRAARGLVAADPDACVLVCSVELCSLHYQYGYNAQRIVSGSLFADGAAGVIVAGPDVDVAGGTEECANVVATGSSLIPNSRDAMTWLIGDHGFEMTLEASVPGLIESHLKPFLEPWLAKYGESVESIAGWAVHPGGIRILQSVESALDLNNGELDISREVLREHGNMSSATLGVVMQKFRERGVGRPWLMLGFGPGLETEVALIR